MADIKRKKKPRGRAFVGGIDARRNPNGRPTKASDTAKTFSECFIKLMNKEVAAQVGSEMVVRPNYEHFIGEMIKAGIKGGKALGKRSQKGRMNWTTYRQLLIAFPLPEPAIHQAWRQ